MLRGALSVLLLLLLSATDGEQPSTSHDAENMGIRSAGNDSYKFQASLWWDSDSSPYCGAALIDEQNLVTAAHCIYDGVLAIMRKPTNYLRVSVGCEDYRECTKHEVGYTYVHPRYNYKTLENDIAVVKLKKPLKLGEDVQIIQLASVSPAPGETCELSGWGAWSNWAEASSSLLQRSPVAVQPLEACSLVRGRRVTDNRLCVASQPLSAHSHADSGGPVTCAGRLAGVVVGADRARGALVVTAVAPLGGFVRDCAADWGRGAWPVTSSVLAGVAQAALSLLATVALAKLSDARGGAAQLQPQAQ